MRWSLPDHTCPRCLGGVPTPSERGKYPGAISRTDNVTEVCSECGVKEALEVFTSALMQQEDWASSVPSRSEFLPHPNG